MRWGLLAVSLLLGACQFSPAVGPADGGTQGFDQGLFDSGLVNDAGARDAEADAGAADTGRDAQATDTQIPDGQPADTGVRDEGFPDAPAADSAPADTGVVDTGAPDDGVIDTGPPDNGVPDTGVPDNGTPDLGQPDLGRPDLGQPDTGLFDAGDAGVVDTGPLPDGGGFPYQPSNLSLPASTYTPPLQSTVISGNCFINTGPQAGMTGNCGPNTTLITDTQGLHTTVVWVHDDFTVLGGASGGVISVTGLFPLIILAHGEVLIEGFIDAAGGAGVNLRAPGAELKCEAQNEAEVGTGGNGGGGGAYGTSGGEGGRRGGGPRPSGGSPEGQTDLIPLRGGCYGRYQIGITNVGGRGGGAVQISAAGSVEIESFAIIDVSGGPGQPGNQNRGGGGGGSGGALLLEANTMIIRSNATLLAGGGGGGGGGSTNSPGTAGERQMTPNQQANGGTEGNFGGEGGDGAIRRLAANRAGDASQNVGSGGGGGGGAGRVRINAHSSCTSIAIETAPVTSGGQNPCTAF